MCAARALKKDTRRVRRGLGRGLGVLLPGVMASFLAKDVLGHDDGNCAIVALWRVFYLWERVTRDSGFVVVGASDAPVPLPQILRYKGRFRP